MADITIEARTYRYTSRYTATSSVTSYLIPPVNGRPNDSYLTIINSGSADLNVAFGSADVDPHLDDYITFPTNSVIEPLPGFFSRGDVTMYITGSSTFHVIR